MEEFFRQNTKNDLHILNEDSLNQQYSPLGPADYVLPLDRYSRMKHIASNFFRKKLGIPRKLKRRSHYNPNAEGHTKGNSSILSSTTDVIDNASYRILNR
ncbi:SPS-sensor component SSY1 [Saccharomyces cerevisiae]|nr:SPS-sensor component SSY1 [Saccharomyces cerevisiae]